MDFRAYPIDKMRELIGVYYYLHSNRANYLKTFYQTDWTFLNLNFEEIYNTTSNILKLILLKVFN